MPVDKHYPRAYVDACRARIEEEIAAFRALTAGSPPAAVEKFEPVCFGNLIVILNAMFIRRESGGAGAESLDEVRLLADSILANGGVFALQDDVAYDPASAVLGIAPGERVVVRHDDFDRLATAYFAAIEESIGER